MEKRTRSISSSWLLADVAITRWLLEADKSAPTLEVGSKPNWLSPKHLMLNEARDKKPGGEDKDFSPSVMSQTYQESMRITVTPRDNTELLKFINQSRCVYGRHVTTKADLYVVAYGRHDFFHLINPQLTLLPINTGTLKNLITMDDVTLILACDVSTHS